MSWTISHDLAEYESKVRSRLEGEPVENTLALTVLASLAGGHRFSDAEPLFGWEWRDGRIAGSLFMTPPFPLALTDVRPEAVAALVSVLRGEGIAVPGANGRPEVVETFASEWLPDADRSQWYVERQRLYVLDRLVPPDPLPAGAARPATRIDLDLLTGWWEAFQLEAHGSSRGDESAQARARIEAGLISVWEHDGGVVSMAARNAAAAGISRVGPVYTPPEHRGHGYGAAVTAACTDDALSSGARDVVLFTDLANPTSNAIYQRIGYRPVSDRLLYEF